MASPAPTVERLHSLLAAGALMHPYLSPGHFSRSNSDERVTCEDDVCDNFVDLAAALALCCGVAPPNDVAPTDASSLGGSHPSNESVKQEVYRRRMQLASEIGGTATPNADGSSTYERRHIILILCDGMGNSILQSALPNNASFFARQNQPSRLRAVFPSTTPAALTTLATAAWPGRHGMPGWNLRDKKGCDFPGPNDETTQPVQLLVLSDRIRDARSGKVASEVGVEGWDEVFVEAPWARKLSGQRADDAEHAQETRARRRRMIYVNAYNGDDYQDWSQGKEERSEATDFSSWFIGDDNTATKDAQSARSHSTLFETAKIEETSYDTLGKPEGSADAIRYFRHGIDAALASIARAEAAGEKTFVYLYTAHPDKHMHALGVEHDEVQKVVRGIEREVERFWNVLRDREALLSGKYDGGPRGDDLGSSADGPGAVDAAVVVTADHGHVTVHDEDMVPLPENILDLLEYACIGVHGKGRHGYLHCRAGLQPQLRKRWRANPTLSENFLLLAVEEAIEHGLFGPECMRLEVRPRLGDFVSVSINRKTLVTPSDVDKYQTQCQCQGAHGSLLPEEMSIPFILLAS